MFFTKEDYKKIQDWILRNSIKDSEFEEASLPLQGEETISFIQNGMNVQVRLKDFISELFNLGVSDFLNISDKYKVLNISLADAIQLIPCKSRKIGQVISFLDENNIWKVYQYIGTNLKQWNIESAWKDIAGTVSESNLKVDNEDITIKNSNRNQVLKFADKDYIPENYSGLGRVYLRKNVKTIINSENKKEEYKNILNQSDFKYDNTIYIIQYNYDLNEQEIVIPYNCVLEFTGGSISNGTIVGTDTLLVHSNTNIFNNIKFKGTWHNSSIDIVDNTLYKLDTVKEIIKLKKDVKDLPTVDEEDITVSENNTIKFKNKEYNEKDFSGLGKIYLRKNIIKDKNILTQEMINKPNTIYVIQYDFTLNDSTIEIPENCILNFQGGSLKNGIITFNNTLLKGNINIKCKPFGILKNKNIKLKWFDNIYLQELINLESTNIIYLDDFEYNIEEKLILKSNLSLIGKNKTILNCKKGIYNHSNSEKNKVYYYPNNNISKIVKDIEINSNKIFIEEVLNYKIGDYIYIYNGYTDMWRVMEQYSTKIDFLKPEVDLYRCVIGKISEINTNEKYIKIESKIPFSVFIKPKTYNFFEDENSIYPFNYPYIEKLDSYNIELKNININLINSSIYINNHFNFLIKNCSINSGNNDSIILNTCLKAEIKNNTIISDNYCCKITRGSSCVDIINNFTYSKVINSDSALLITAMSYNNRIENNKVYEVNSSATKDKIGIYVNTCKENIVFNNYVEGFNHAYASMFNNIGNNIVYKNVAKNCNNIIALYCSSYEFFDDLILISYNSLTDNHYTTRFMSVSESHNISIKNINGKLLPKGGRFHIFRSFNVTLDNINAENIVLEEVINDYKKLFPSLPNFILTNSNLGTISIKGSDKWNDSSQRIYIIKDCNFNHLYLEKCVHSIIKNCKIIDSEEQGITISSSNFNNFINCYIEGKDIDISFGEENSSQTNICNSFENCIFKNGKFKGYYKYPLQVLENRSVGTTVVGEKVTLLDDYPNLHTYFYNGKYWESKLLFLDKIDKTNIINKKSIFSIFDKLTNKPIWWTGEKWVDATGNNIE